MKQFLTKHEQKICYLIIGGWNTASISQLSRLKRRIISYFYLWTNMDFINQSLQVLSKNQIVPCNLEYLARTVSMKITVKNLLHLPITICQNVYFDYIYIDDLLRMVDYTMHHDIRHKIYNVSRGEKVDLVTLAWYVNSMSDFRDGGENAIFSTEENLHYIFVRM